MITIKSILEQQSHPKWLMNFEVDMGKDRSDKNKVKIYIDGYSCPQSQMGDLINDIDKRSDILVEIVAIWKRNY